MTDRDQQDRQAFEEFCVRNLLMNQSDLMWLTLRNIYFNNRVHMMWQSFRAALRIAEERRRQERPVAEAYMSESGHTIIKWHRNIEPGVKLILRDKEQP